MLTKFMNGPIGRDIRTAEGALVYLTNLLLAVIAGISPSSVSPHEAAILVTITTALHVISSKAQNIFKIQKGLGLGEPAQINPDELAEKVSHAIGLQSVPNASEIQRAITDAVNEGFRLGNQGILNHIAQAITVQNPAPAPVIAPPVPQTPATA